MSTTLKPFSIDELAVAIADYQHIKQELNQVLMELGPKRNMVAALEKREHELLQKLQQQSAKIRKIGKGLE